jgi:hypothetical protein
MTRVELEFAAGEYATVAERIEAFYSRYPEGRIITELIQRTDAEVTFRAKVYRGAGDLRPAATGWASEREGDGAVNEFACLENTETSAVGRALANLGFASSVRRPSAEEIARVERLRSRAARRVGEPGSNGASDARVAARQVAADALADVYRLLGEAERVGMRGARVAALRERLAASPNEEEVAQLEAALRDYLSRRDRERLGGTLGSRGVRRSSRAANE